jgi:hypothetical protein
MAGKKRRQHSGPALRLTLTGKPEIARAPTEDELWDLLKAWWDWLAALPGPQQPPPELRLRLRQLIEWQIVQRPWRRRRIQFARWALVCDAIKRVGWKEAFKDAARMSAGTPFEARPHTMNMAYVEVQRSLPPAQRRPRIYRPYVKTH